MAEKLVDAFDVLSVGEVCAGPPVLDDATRTASKELEQNYESIFFWKIKELTGDSQNLLLNVIYNVKEKYDMIVDKENAFNLTKFYLKLIMVYEQFTNGNFSEALVEIESVINFLNTSKYDESDAQHSVYNHIAWSSKAYIELILNLDYKKATENIKSIKSFNKLQKAAIFALKARVFMEYPPKGNDIALKFADEARYLNPTELEWVVVWLKAQGRVRRFYHQYQMVYDTEIEAAEMLSKAKTNPHLLYKASKPYMERGFYHKLNKNYEESMKFYRLSSNIAFEAVKLAGDDIKLLYSFLLIYVEYPKDLHSKSVVDEVIKKLKNVNNSRVDQILGKYYLKFEKDYENAKMYFSRGMSAGHFNSALQLIKVECILQPVDQFPLVQTLNMLYDVFPSPKRRLIILSQILLYYYYYENNPKEMMHYLKLYMNQDIDDEIKKSNLIFTYPLFNIKGYFQPKQFLNLLSIKIKELAYSIPLSIDERKIIDDTINKFNKMSTTKMNETKNFKADLSDFHKQSYDNSSNNKYHFEQSKNQTKNVYRYNQQTNYSNENSSDVFTKKKKFEAQHKNFGYLHSVSMEIKSSRSNSNSSFVKSNSTKWQFHQGPMKNQNSSPCKHVLWRNCKCVNSKNTNSNNFDLSGNNKPNETNDNYTKEYCNGIFGPRREYK